MAEIRTPFLEHNNDNRHDDKTDYYAPTSVQFDKRTISSKPIYEILLEFIIMYSKRTWLAWLKSLIKISRRKVDENNKYPSIAARSRLHPYKKMWERVIGMYARQFSLRRFSSKFIWLFTFQLEIGTSSGWGKIKLFTSRRQRTALRSRL